LGIVALAALVALLPIAWAAPRTATQNVTLKDNLFDPKTITVQVGDTVMWMDQGQNEHTVTADDGSFGSGELKVGEKTSFSATFPKGGTFPYHCKYHAALGMVGRVVVQAAAAPAAPAAPPTAAAPIAAAAPTAAAPSKLPRTSGEDAPLAVMVLAAL